MGIHPILQEAPLNQTGLNEMSELSRPSKTGPEIVAITIAAMAIGLAFTLALQRGGKAANNE